MAFIEFNNDLLLLYRAAQEKCVSEFHEFALGICKTYLHFDSAIVGGGEVTEGSLPVITSVHLHNQPTQKLLDRAKIKEQDPVLMAAFRQPGRSVQMAMTHPDVPGEFREHARQYGISHVLSAARIEGESCRMDLISLWRAADDDLFTEREMGISDILLPHLLEARMINLRLYTDEASVRTARQSRPVVANMRGEVQFMEVETVALLRKEWPDWSPPILPKDLVAQVEGEQRRSYAGKRLAVNASLKDQLLYLQFRESAAIQERPLTQEEESVARLAVTGASYKDIARRLHKSPSTVRNQLHSVYDKLQVKNKTELAEFIMRN